MYLVIVYEFGFLPIVLFTHSDVVTPPLHYYLWTPRTPIIYSSPLLLRPNCCIALCSIVRVVFKNTGDLESRGDLEFSNSGPRT